ncbi:hypothetical protein WKH57_01375 [Niallia taxi]|uniref:hypothetical protein n=1 Tax=Niallia taxi TaxID=2499688 RepID=UPI003175D8D2
MNINEIIKNVEVVSENLGYIDLEDFNNLVYTIRTYDTALNMIADHKNTLYAAIAQKALDEVNK